MKHFLCTSIALALLTTLGVTTGNAAALDSQIVLGRYVRALDALVVPKNVIYSYAVSQAGPPDIEQKHLVYRSGSAVRDELLGGSTIKPKETIITDRVDRYAIARVAPRPGVYGFLFVRTVVENGSMVYLYDTFPLSSDTSGFAVTEIAIDAASFLPRRIAFRTTNGVVTGKGQLQYVPVEAYWMPVSATISVALGGKPAQERITWSGYRFPAALPALTFTR